MYQNNFDPMTGKPLNPTPPEPPKKSKKPVIIAAIAGAVVLWLALSIVGVFTVAKLFAKGTDSVEEDVIEETAELQDDDDYGFLQEPETQEDEPSEDLTEDITEDKETSEKPAAISSNRQQPDPNGFYAFTIGDVTYELPEKVSDFLEDGWTFNSDKDATEMLGAGGSELYRLYYPGDDFGLSVTIKNFDIDSKQAQDCYLTEMTINNVFSESEGVTVSIHGGDIVIGKSTGEDIRNIYGEPDYEGNSLGDYYIYYNLTKDEDIHSGEELNFNLTEEGVLEILTIANSYEPEGVEKSEVSTDEPDYLSKYEAPEELGDDLISGNFKVSNVVYNLPCPLQAFIDDGWKHDYDEDYVLGAKQGGTMMLEKGDLNLFIVIGNYSEKSSLLKYAIVTSIEIGYPPKIELPGGIKIDRDCSYDDFMAYLNKSGIKNYEYDEANESLSIPFDQTRTAQGIMDEEIEIEFSDGKVCEVSIRRYGWLAD